MESKSNSGAERAYLYYRITMALVLNTLAAIVVFTLMDAVLYHFHLISAESNILYLGFPGVLPLSAVAIIGLLPFIKAYLNINKDKLLFETQCRFDREANFKRIIFLIFLNLCKYSISQ